MPAETQSTNRDDSTQIEARATEARAAAEGAPVEHGPAAAPARRSARKRRLLIGVIGVLVLAVVAAFGVPYVRRTLNTVSTDDAYVNGHVTFVAPRVGGQVARVLVDDNNRVHKGDLLVQLDKEPYAVQLNIAQASVDAAQSDLVAAQADIRAAAGKARAARYGLEHAVEDVENEVALLHARVATLQSQQAILARAKADYDRA